MSGPRQRRYQPWVSVLVAVGWLVVGVGLQGRARVEAVAEPGHRPLREQLPAALAGWSVHEVLLGGTAEKTAEVAKMLAFDDHVYRLYQRGGGECSVYAAYWRPGRLPARMVAGHTPDICWVGQGYEVQAYANRQRLRVGAVEVAPVEWRRFADPAGRTQEVYYWLRSGPEFFDFGTGAHGGPSVTAWLRDALAQTFWARHHQYFVRLTLSGAWAEWEATPGFTELVRSVAAIGAEGAGAAGREEGRGR